VHTLGVIFVRFLAIQRRCVDCLTSYSYRYYYYYYYYYTVTRNIWRHSLSQRLHLDSMTNLHRPITLREENEPSGLGHASLSRRNQISSGAWAATITVGTEKFQTWQETEIRLQWLSL